MSNKIPWDLIQKYITGNCNPETRDELAIWMNEEPGNKQIVEDVQEIWDLSYEKELHIDEDYSWNEFYKKNIINESNKKNDLRYINNLNNSFKNLRLMYNTAAVVLVAIFTGFLTFLQIITWNEDTFHLDNIINKELSTASNEKANITLPDGTEVILNSVSTIHYPEYFHGTFREVYLNGEAYFKVSSDQDKPFIVHTAEATIKVLGTKFNVQAWNDDLNTDVVVQEGKVSVASVITSDFSREVLLQGGEYTRIHAGKNPLPPQKVNTENYLLWTGDGLFFYNKPFKDVISQIERIYNIEIKLLDNSVENVPLTSTFDNSDLYNVLNVISAAMNLEYQWRGDNVILHNDPQQD